MRVAVFDLDGTITRADTLWPYLRGWVRRQRRPGFWRSALVAAGRYPFDRDRGRLKFELIRAAMGGATRSEVAAWTATFVAGLGDAELCPGALAAIARHRAAGDRLVLLSASVDTLRPGHRPATGLRRDDLHRGRLARRAARRRAGDGKSPRRRETALHRGAPRPPPGRAHRRLRQRRIGFRSPRDRGRAGSRQRRPVTQARSRTKGLPDRGMALRLTRTRAERRAGNGGEDQDSARTGAPVERLAEDPPGEQSTRAPARRRRPPRRTAARGTAATSCSRCGR